MFFFKDWHRNSPRVCVLSYHPCVIRYARLVDDDDADGGVLTWLISLGPKRVPLRKQIKRKITPTYLLNPVHG